MYSWIPKLGTQVSKVQGRAHADGRQIGRAVETGSHLMDGGEVRQAADVGDTAAVDDSRADVVDELRFNEMFAIPD